MEPIKVLLVDDEEDFLEPLAKRLSKRRMTVATAGNGAAALEILETIDIDVVLLDVKMPGQDGIQVLKEIKKNKPLVEVIMLTGHASVEAAISGMALGAFDYLMKPMGIDEIVFKLQDAYKSKALQEKKIRNIAARGKVQP
jgi:DNA-binding NtrC family response regulator